jgi:subtilisin family serine protease
MKGMKEILVSFTVAFATLGTYAYLKREIKNAGRTQNDSAPTQVSEAPEDPQVSLNWGLEAIASRQAWRKQTGSKKITVAIIDTGCDTQHPSLRENIWRNPGESGLDENGMSRATNGIDDDDNGFVDDVYGWNFADDSPDVMDEHGHGTHIAGIIGAKRGNGLPLSGVSPDVSLMILKYYDAKSTGADNLENTIRAIRYAVRMGANVINYSGGGILKSRDEEDMLRWAGEQGVLVVAAAGNEGMNSDFFHFYPADYDLPNILSVGAIDRFGQLMDLSNYGLHTVDIAAPGKNIYSTLPNGQFGYMSGTSQATAFATGVAVLLMAQDARMQSPQALIKHLAGHGRPSSRLKTRIRSGSVLDAGLSIDGLALTLAQENNAKSVSR